MSRRRYPYLRESGCADKPEGDDCICCDKPATHWVRIAWSYMRGEDDGYGVCQRHFQMAEDNFDRFRAHWRTKDKFLASKAATPETEE